MFRTHVLIIRGSKLHSLWYHHTYRCDDTRGCVMQFWPPDDEHMCSKHVEAWNKLIVKQKFSASSWLNTEINLSVLYTEIITVYSEICIKHINALCGYSVEFFNVESCGTNSNQRDFKVLVFSVSLYVRTCRNVAKHPTLSIECNLLRMDVNNQTFLSVLAELTDWSP